MRETGNAFQLRLPGFDGPLTELFRLASERRVDVESMMVAGVTSQIARYVSESYPLDLDVAGDAVAVAARLLALKSGRLLLRETFDDDDQLPTYASREPLMEPDLLHRYKANLYALEGRETFPLPSGSLDFQRRLEPRDAGSLSRAWLAMSQRSHDVAVRVTFPSFMRLEVAISGLIRSLRVRPRLSFYGLTRHVSKNDAVVHFLALLELCRRHDATASQTDLFGDITIESEEHGADAETAADQVG